MRGGSVGTNFSGVQEGLQLWVKFDLKSGHVENSRTRISGKEPLSPMVGALWSV